MARYTGPKLRLERREKTSLFGTDKWRKRGTFPGQHGASFSRQSSYSIQFREKQKVKRMYGLLERQFKNTYGKAVKLEGNTGLNFLKLLELRLDNVVFRLGLAKTRMQARQFVTHGHVKVNNKKLDIASYTCSVGDVITLDDSLASSAVIGQIQAEQRAAKSPEWLNRLSNGGDIKAEPRREDIDRGINEQQIVELYSGNY